MEHFKSVFILILMLLSLFTQSLWAVDSVPMIENLNLANITAQVVWSKSPIQKVKDQDEVRYDPKTNLYWGSDEYVIKAKDEISQVFSYETLNGQGGWRLPSCNEIMMSGKMELMRMYGGGLLVNEKVGVKDENIPLGSQYKTAVCDRVVARKYHAPNSWKILDGCVCADAGLSYKAIPVRSPSASEKLFETIKVSNKSPEQKVSEFAAYLVSNKLTVTMPELRTPAVPQRITPNHLDKGEFETTDSFQKRMDAEIERVRSANEAAQSSYDDALKQHQADEVAQQLETEQKHRQNKEPEALRAALTSALAEAMTMLYGDPILTDLKYNADKQTFSGILKSEKGGFSREIEFAVSLNKAAFVKEQMSDTRLIPTVTFNIKGTEFTFAKLDVIDNAVILQQDFAVAKNTNTIAAYENFLKLHPDTPPATQAKQNILALQEAAVTAQKAKEAAAERERLAAPERERQRQRDAALEEQHAIAEAKKLAILGPCKVGSTVHHRERWNTTTSSGNAIADVLFGAATKEQFLIIFEGVVEGFAGDKVKVSINDYQVQQTKGGGFFSRKTYQGESLGIYADKYIGKTQYYPRSRCSK